MHLVGYETSKLLPFVSMPEDDFVGEAVAPIDQIGDADMIEVSGVDAPMPRVDAPTDRRWIHPKDFQHPQRLDSFEESRILHDPRSKFSRVASRAAGKKIDQLLIAAAFATATTGKAAGSTEAFTSGQTIAKDVHGSNTGLTAAKIEEVIEKFHTNNLDPDRNPLYAAISPIAHKQLMRDPGVANSMYSDVRPGVSGRVRVYMGITFIITTLLDVTSNIRDCIFWTKEGLMFGFWKGKRLAGNVSQRNDLEGEPWQLYTKATMNGVRTELQRVVKVEVDETVV